MLEKLFRRYFWTFHATCLAVAAFILAGTVNAGVAHFLRGAFAVKESGGKKRAPRTRAVTRDFEAASEANIFDGKREVVEVVDLTALACTTDADCEEGQVCADVEDAAEGEPAKQCQLPGEDGDCAAAFKSDLNLRLIGTTVFPSNPEQSLATIVDQATGRRAKGELYSTNNCEGGVELPPDAGPANEARFVARPSPCNDIGGNRIVRILPDKVYLQNRSSGRCEYISLDDPPEKPTRSTSSRIKRKNKRKGKEDPLAAGITKSGPNSYEITQDTLSGAMENMSKLATQARIVPAFEGGQAIGFKLFSIRPGSLYSKIGIQNGDIIQKVNGYDISSPDKALELYQKLKDGKAFSVDIKRRGKPVTLEYTITP